jgi:hypothetical protein
MLVNFDTLRLRIAHKYNALSKIVTKMEQSPERDELRDTLDGLHNYVATLLSCESDGDKFKSIDFQMVGVDWAGEDDED